MFCAMKDFRNEQFLKKVGERPMTLLGKHKHILNMQNASLQVVVSNNDITQVHKAGIQYLGHGTAQQFVHIALPPL